MRIIGIETSCDETGIAIYDDEKGLLSHKLYSQVNCMPIMVVWCLSWLRVIM